MHACFAELLCKNERKHSAFYCKNDVITNSEGYFRNYKRNMLGAKRKLERFRNMNSKKYQIDFFRTIDIPYRSIILLYTSVLSFKYNFSYFCRL